MTPVRILLSLLILSGLGLLGGCATNPVTGDSDFVLMSEESEIALGRQHHKKVLESYDLYANTKLQNYVDALGKKIATKSHRQDLIFRFHVLDSAEVNAFALPGGYIYITRGLMAYLKSEAELAAVLGHEIGHVTARHSVRQHSATTAAGLIGAIISASTGVSQTRDLTSLLGTAMVRGYGRNHELQADRLGAEYLAATGYNPEEMSNVIAVLKDQEEFEKQRAKEEHREARSYHGLFATHPDNDRRLQEVINAAKRFKSPIRQSSHEARYLNAIDGLTFADSAHEGVIRGQHFFHSDLDFGINFPQGWKIRNQSNRVTATAPAKDVRIALTVQDINKRMDPRKFISARLGLELTAGRKLLNKLPGYTGLVSGDQFRSGLPHRVAVLYLNDQAYIFSARTPDEATLTRFDKDFLATMRSFHPLSKRERELAQPLEIRVIKAKNRDSYRSLAKVSRIPNYPETQLRLLNGDYPDGHLQAGRQIKVVH